jgi:hypothetical protein
MASLAATVKLPLLGKLKGLANIGKNPRKRGRLLIYPVGIRGKYGGRSTHLTFEIKIELARPGEILFEDEPLPNEDAALAI